MKSNHRQAIISLLMMLLAMLIMWLPGVDMFTIGIMCVFFGLHAMFFLYHVMFYPFLQRAWDRNTEYFERYYKLLNEHNVLLKKYKFALDAAREKK